MKKSRSPGTLHLNARNGHFPFFPIYNVRPAAAGLSTTGLQIALHATRSPVTLGSIKKLGLEPVIGINPRILILGSLPGDESLRKQEYYGNPRNMFWNVISGILEEKAPITYREKVEYLKRHGLALWDVLHAAERAGSLDASIRNEEFNDIAQLLSDNPSIEVIATNGGKAEKSFRKYLRRIPSIAGKRIYHCASTSSMSICAGWDLERLIDQWREIL